MELSYEQRCDLIDKISQRYLESMDGRGLEQFFLDVNAELLSCYGDEELLTELSKLVDEDEFQEIMSYGT